MLLLAALLTACAPAPADPTDPTDPDGYGTEIGDEGGWMCVEEEQPVGDTSAEIAALGASPDELLALAAGDFVGDAALTLTPDLLSVSFFDYEPAEWEDEDPPPYDEPECTDVLWVMVHFDFSSTPLTVSTDNAEINFYEGGGARFRAQLEVFRGEAEEDEYDDEEGDWEEEGDDYGDPDDVIEYDQPPSSFVIEDMAEVQIWIDGELEGERWVARAYWGAETWPQGEDANVEWIEEDIWSGALIRD